LSIRVDQFKSNQTKMIVAPFCTHIVTLHQRNASYLRYICLSPSVSHIPHRSFVNQNWNEKESSSYFMEKLLLTLVNGKVSLRSKG